MSHPQASGNFVVTWAAGIAATFAVGYVLLGSYLPSISWPKRTESVPGLYNRYGNDCFVNCILQVSLSLNQTLIKELGWHTFFSRVPSETS
jgi:hypothetical protein